MLIPELYCLQVIYCTKDMIKLSVWDAMHIEQPDLEDVKVRILIYYYLYVHPIFLALFKVHILYVLTSSYSSLLFQWYVFSIYRLQNHCQEYVSCLA